MTKTDPMQKTTADTIRQNLLMAQEMIAKAGRDVAEAVAAASEGNMDGAIGASINTPADLDTARSLVDAAMTLNRYRRRS